jgi:RNA polymerase-associated protein RTF1
MSERRKDKGKKAKLEREEFYLNDEDRTKLEQMTELEREKILQERYDAKVLDEERKQLLKEKNDKENKTAQDKQKDALKDIQKKRNQNIKKESVSESESGEILDDEEEDSSDESGSRISDSLFSAEEEEKTVKKELKSTFKLTMQELEKIRVSRVMIEKWWEHSFFENTIKGCFIRLNVCRDKNSNMFEYMIAEIKEIVENPAKPYNFMGKTCIKYIKAKHSKYEKTFNLAIISNSPFDHNEYDIWLNKMNQVIKILLSMV